jgi:ATP-dependent DNA helicase RecG
MKIEDIKNAVSTIQGIGPATASLLAKLNIFTVGDLLQFYPRSFDDRTKRVSLSEALHAAKVHTIAQVQNHEWFGYGKMRTLKISIDDGTATAELIAFNRPFLENMLPIGSIIAVTGVFTSKFGTVQSTSFETAKIAPEGAIEQYQTVPVPDSRVIPVYPLTEGLSQKVIQKAIRTALVQYGHGIDDEIPEPIRTKRNLITKEAALYMIHMPKTLEDAEKAQHTLVFEELFKFQKMIAASVISRRGTLPLQQGTVPVQAQPEPGEDLFYTTLSPRQKKLHECLPFTLTTDQKSVITAMNRDVDHYYLTRTAEKAKPFSMRVLLQGDVGSGKTLTAFFVCLRIIDYGGQCAIMAPTELLARQHADNAAKLLEKIDVQVAFLTGSSNASGKAPLLAALKKGTVNLVVGTHALFSRETIYHDLALTVIDEQHRFGVIQRSAILEKGRYRIADQAQEPNLLMMSATPIPQTLALSLYGDLDILQIHSMPEGRKPVVTYLVKEGHEHNAYEAVRKELAAGHQAYFVYPAIEDTGENKLKAAEAMYQHLTQTIYPGIPAARIHGRIDDAEQNEILKKYAAGEIKILVATTIVEVGVDVPNATCMVIEQADRFGLAELHQLRGRVGRGHDQSYCFLIYSDSISKTGIARIKIIRESTDGFEIAEEDLKLRGPGEITGTVQAGQLSFAIADPVRDRSVMEQARIDAFEICTKN